MKTRKFARSVMIAGLYVGLIVPTPLLAEAPGDASTRAVPAAPANPTPTMYSLTYGKPYLDAYEWRDKPRRHLYIHGGFENSHLRFSVYLPPKELYRKRFLLMLEGGTGGTEKMMTLPGGGGEHESWDFAFDVAFDRLGAYLVETNEGHFPDEGLGTDTAEHLWAASGYATNYVRNLAAQVYGERPAFGYVQGCSGGGTRSSRHVENLPDLINGSVSQSWGHLGLEQWSVYGLASRLLGEKMEGVKDALEPGGSGDPYAGLNSVQSEALRDLLGMGIIRDAVFQYKKTGWFTTPVQMYHIQDKDPTYFQDFWTKPGYEGYDQAESIKTLLVDEEVEVGKVFTVGEMGRVQGSSAGVAAYGPGGSSELQKKQAAILKFDGPADKLVHATITIQSGPDKGKQMIITQVGGGKSDPYLVRPFTGRAAYAFDNVKEGDKVRVSNRDMIAYLYYYRHVGQSTTKLLGLDTPRYPQLFPEFRVLMKPDGSPRYVQRPPLVTHVPQSANFTGKIIALSGEGDEAIWPTSMNAYVRRVHKNLGAKVDNQFRMWWIDDHAHCGGRLTGPMSTRIVPAEGLTQQALIDLADWVEKGTPPAASNPYTFSPDNKILISDNAKIKRGIQPVAKLAVGGGDRIEVAVGTPVTFAASAEVPPGAGSIVEAVFDFDEQGKWPAALAVSGDSPTVRGTATHVYDKPGTYFAAFRVGSHREGSKRGKGDLPIYDLARVRVVVK